MKIEQLNLKMFFSEKDFFTNAFEEAYNISEGTPEPLEEPETPQDEANDEIPAEDNQVEDTPTDASTELSPDEVKALYEKHFGQEEDEEEEYEEEELDEDTQNALELYKYLEQNQHLVQAMREYDAQGYQQLNKFVPDEITRELNSLKEFKADYEYDKYIGELKSKYSDFDEEKVLAYAEKTNTVDLEVVYKAMRSETMQQPNVDEMREQIKKELLEELKQNSINTQSLIGGTSQKPINNEDNVSLTSREERIARAMGVSPKEYAKWR